jgi:putative tricarboxylic transport membrane protein
MEYFIILFAPVIGVLVGLIPALGATLTLILMYPLLMQLEPLTLILFYAVMVNARDFSGSVSAISFGLLGEITSIPALKERQVIVKDNRQLNALRNTMLGSLFGMFFGTGLLYFSVTQAINYPLLLRSDVLALFILITAGFLTFWTGNKWYINIFLMMAGYFLGEIGFDTIKNREFFTFSNAYLSGGLPMLPLLLGLYAVPKMIQIASGTKPNSKLQSGQKIDFPVGFPTMLRGSAIGAIAGMVPFIGTTISSNIAHFTEQKFYSANNSHDALLRLTAAETANNAGQVTMLIPLLVLGIALQPSELILLDMLEAKGWLVSTSVDWMLLASLLIVLPVGSLITAFICYNAVKKLLSWFSIYFKNIIALLIFITVIDIVYTGYTADQIMYYSLVFVLSAVIGLSLQKKFDFVPLILIFLLHNSFSDVAQRLPLIYGW